MTNRITRSIITLVASAMLLTGCATAAGAEGGSTGSAEASAATELRLGYFANVTHAPALVGVEEGILQKDLGDTTLTTQVFNAGPAAIEALSAGAIDATYIGPNPAINSYIQSAGESVRVIAGATVGGAALVVRDGIDSAADLKGATLATPQLGGTQDVALRSWLKEQGYATDISGGGDVTISPTENAQTLTLFQDGQIDGAWLPEPWVSRLVLEGGAHVLVDEKDLWQDGAFPTTILIVNADFLAEHPETVRALLQGHVESLAWLADNATTAATAINTQLEADTGKKLKDEVITRALQNVSFTADPHAETFATLVEKGLEAGTQKKGSIDGLFDLRELNAVLTDAGEPTVSAGGLGEDTP